MTPAHVAAGENTKNAAGNDAICLYKIACEAGLPINIATPTWRANQERVLEAGIGKNINGDAVRFLNDFIAVRFPGRLGKQDGCPQQKPWRQDPWWMLWNRRQPSQIYRRKIIPTD